MIVHMLDRGRILLKPETYGESEVLRAIKDFTIQTTPALGLSMVLSPEVFASREVETNPARDPA